MPLFVAFVEWLLKVLDPRADPATSSQVSLSTSGNLEGLEFILLPLVPPRLVYDTRIHNMC